MMNFEEFKEKIITELGEATGYDIIPQTIKKNNGVSYEAVQVDRGDMITPVVYLEKRYSDYKNGQSFESVIQEICVQCKEENTPQFSLEEFLVWENAQNRICYKLVNKEKNEELISRSPHRVVFGDLAIVYYYLFSNDETEAGSITITNEHMKMWKVTEEELEQYATMNTPQILPYQIQNMMEAIGNIMGEDIPDYGEDVIPMYVMTNNHKINGAATILYPGALKDFAEKMGGRNLYVIPSSIHEQILIPAKGDEDVEELNETVKIVNGSDVRADEVLADHVYYYDYQTNLVTAM